MHESAAAEARFRGFIEVAPDAIVTVDRQGTIVLVNGQTEALFGYDRAEMLGQPIAMLLPESIRPVHRAHREAYMEAPRIRPMGADLDLHARRKDGSEFPVEISLGPVQADGELLVIATLRDITERKQVEAAIQTAREEAEQANQAKSDFLSRMSHELRTPLNAILGFGQLLGMERLTDEQADSVEHILRAGRHLLELINEVLDISRIEAGRLSLSPEPVSVDEVLLETQDLVRPMARQSNILLKEEPHTAGLHVLSDRQRLRQVVLNLLTNAVKYNRAGGTVTVTCSEPAPGFVRIAVSDQGSGIAAEQMSRLFTPFERLGAEQTDVEGTGLGLALSKRLVDAMGGTLGVDTRLGEGSTFWVELPFAKSVIETKLADGDEAAEALHEQPAKQHTVLYIEDNLDSYQLMERIFAHWPGVKLISAMQGRLGVDLATQHHPDLLLLDLHLPDIQGLEVLQRLRANPSTSDIPIVVTSADATAGQIERLRAAGANDYLTKPLDLRLFADTVRRYLD